MVPAELEDLGADEAFDQAEHVGVGPPLDLAQPPLVVIIQEIELAGQAEAVRQILLGKRQASPPDDIGVDVPADTLGSGNAARVGAGNGDC